MLVRLEVLTNTKRPIYVDMSLNTIQSIIKLKQLVF